MTIPHRTTSDPMQSMLGTSYGSNESGKNPNVGIFVLCVFGSKKTPRSILCVHGGCFTKILS